MRTPPRCVQGRTASPVQRGFGALRGALDGLFSILAFSILAVGAARDAHAGEPPLVYHPVGPTGHVTPQVANLGASGLQTLELYLKLGTVVSDTAQQELCVDGTGDEICGFTLELEATGGVSIVEFCPGGWCAGNLVHYREPTTGILRINRLGPAITQSQMPFYVGRLTVQPSAVAGELRIAAGSEAVAANLQIVNVRDPGPIALSLPEPGAGLGVASAILALAALARSTRRAGGARPARRSGRESDRRRATCASVLLALLLGTGRAADAQQFSSATNFTNAATALGSPPDRLGFEAVPRTPQGFAALGQGVRFSGLSLRSLSLANDLDLAFQPGVPLGLFGTLLVADPALSGNPALHPGGTAQGGGARGDDDLRINFDVPMRAAGLTILENVVDAGESVDFVDATGQTIVSIPLPGSGAPPGANGFVGYVIQPGDAPIARLEVRESATDGDDLAIDEILYGSSADSFADAVASFAPAVVAGEPISANLDASRSLARPDAQAVSLGSGGSLTVEFRDNVLSGSGGSLPDLRIHEIDFDLEGSTILVSANGASFTPVGTVAGGTQTLDLDAAGFGPEDRLAFVRIVDDPLAGPTAGPSVGADIDAVEALSGTFRAADGDADGVPDAYDDCPAKYDVAQRDDDADGVGNVCDNCRVVPNPSQDDLDLDGVGNACEPLRVRLRRDFNPVPLDGKARLGSLFLDCGGFDVTAIVVGIWVPPGPAFFDFGGNCMPPHPTFAPPGAPTGSGCTGTGIVLGPTVDGQRSGAFGVPRGDPMPPGFRDDVLYLSLRAPQDGKLCAAFQTIVQLGQLRATTPLGLAPGAVASISLEDPIDAGWCLAEDGAGACRDSSYLAYSMTSGAPFTAEIRLQPAAGQAGVTAVEWDACVADTTVSYMHRVTLGLLGPNGADYPSLFLDGCQGQPQANGRRDCGGEVGTDPEWVDENVTFTQGPLLASLATLLPETLYTPLEGGSPGPGGADVLNPYLGRDACVGIVTNATPPATAGAPPIPVRDGFEQLNYHDAPNVGAQPYQTADAVLQALDGARVFETIVFNSGDDLDGDGFTDPVDNCPFEPNADQSDDGGFASTLPNGHGNACECGDANGSGRVLPASSPETGPGGVPLVPDLDLLREYLVGMHPDDPDLARLCSVHGDSSCDTADLVVLERAFAGLEADPKPRCDAAVD